MSIRKIKSKVIKLKKKDNYLVSCATCPFHERVDSIGYEDDIIWCDLINYMENADDIIDLPSELIYNDKVYENCPFSEYDQIIFKREDK